MLWKLFVGSINVQSVTGERSGKYSKKASDVKKSLDALIGERKICLMLCYDGIRGKMER